MTPREHDETRAHVLITAGGFAVVGLAALAALLIVGLGSSAYDDVVSAPHAAHRTQHQARGSGERRQLFAPTSFWNKRLPATVPVDPSSTVLVESLVAEVERERASGIGPWISAGSDSLPLYRVRRGQRRGRVRLADAKQSWRRSLQRAFASVPIPAGAKPAASPDRHMAVWQPSTDQLWEFFGARREADGWHALWGGAIRRVSKSQGYYTAAAWPGATPAWGATASSLPVAGGTMLLDELKRGRIDHALGINVPQARAGVFAWPAQRTDGVGPPTALPEGARLRLDPTLDVRALKVPKLTRMIALAAQRYGLVVRDQTGHGLSLFGENPSGRREDPYRRYFRGRTPQELLAGFPWERLQVLEMHLCTTAPCKRP